MTGMLRSLFLAGAALLVGYWLGHRQAIPPLEPQTPPTPANLADASAEGVSGKPVKVSPTFPNMAAPIESATPAEIAALRQAEVVNSGARRPVAGYKGPDGRQHAFRYESTPAEAARQRAQEDREAALMRELESDPAAFARKYSLRAREIELILDGSMPLPPALVESAAP